MPYSCPRWDQDDFEHKSAELAKALAEVLARSLPACRARVPGRDDLLAWHHGLFSAVAPLSYYAGNFRQHDPARVCLGIDVGVGSLPGSHFKHVDAHVRQLCAFMLRQAQDLELRWDMFSEPDRVKLLATLVGQAIGAFVKIHPFVNGNGRMSRLLWRLLLHRFQLPAQSSVIKRPAPPYGAVMEAAMRGDYAPAIAMVLVGLANGAAPSLPTP